MPNDGRLTQFARANRKNLTRAERDIWERLRAGRLNGLKFRRQQPMGYYIVDFCCPMARVVVEIDGITHEQRMDKDAIRDRYLLDQGYLVLRFTEDRYYADPFGCLEEIEAACAGVTRELR